MAGEKVLHVGEDQLNSARKVLQTIGSTARSILDTRGNPRDSYSGSGRRVYSIAVPETGQEIDIFGSDIPSLYLGGYGGSDYLKLVYTPSAGPLAPGYTIPGGHSIVFNESGAATVDSTFYAGNILGNKPREFRTLEMDGKGLIIIGDEFKNYFRGTLGQLVVASEILEDAANGHLL